MGKKGDFIRSKSDWNTVNDNVKWFCDYALNSKNIYLGIATTLSLYNVFYFKELIDWINDTIPIKLLNGKDQCQLLSTNKCFSPEHLSIYNLSNNKKKELINKLEKEFISNDFIDNKALEKWDNWGKWVWQVNRIIKTIIKDLNTDELDSNDTRDTNTVTTFNSFNYIESKIDKVRNENWQKTFPELKDFLNE